MKDWVEEVKDTLKIAEKQNKADADKYFGELAMEVYRIFQDELQKAGNPYSMNKPVKQRDGSWILTPDDPKKAWEVEFGKFEQGNSFTKTNPDQIVRRAVYKTQQMLMQEKREFLDIRVKSDIRNPTN